MDDSPYERRTMQLRDARVALVDAVSALTEELAIKRQERDQAMTENRELREYAHTLERELVAARDDIAVLQGMKVVRWTAGPRRLVSRIRARLR